MYTWFEIVQVCILKLLSTQHYVGCSNAILHSRHPSPAFNKIAFLGTLDAQKFLLRRLSERRYFNQTDMGEDKYHSFIYIYKTMFSLFSLHGTLQFLFLIHSLYM